MINIIFITVNLYNDSNLYKKLSIDINDFKHASFETLKMSIPITCNRMSSIVLQSISYIIIPSRLILANMSYTAALGAYGIISGMVMPFIYLPFSVGSALVVNLIPSISGEVALKNNNLLMKKIKYSIGLTLFVSVLCSILFYFLGEDICLLFFKNKIAGQYLKAMFLAPIFLSLNQTLSAILHGIRKEFISSFNTILGMAIQLICLYFLLPIPSLNIYAYIYVVTGAAIFTTLLHSISLIHALKNSNKVI